MNEWICYSWPLILSTSIIRVYWLTRRFNWIHDYFFLENEKNFFFEGMLRLERQKNVRYRFVAFPLLLFLIRFLFFVFVLFQHHSFPPSLSLLLLILFFSINSFLVVFFSNNGSMRSSLSIFLLLPHSFSKPRDIYLYIKLIEFSRKAIDHSSFHY